MHSEGSHTSLIPSSGIYSIRSPLLQRGARITMNSKLPLALVHFGFLVSRTHQAKVSHLLSQVIDSNQQEAVGLLLQDRCKEEYVSILGNPCQHLLVLSCQMWLWLDEWNNLGSRREWLSGSETHEEWRFRLYTGNPPNPVEVITEGEI